MGRSSDGGFNGKASIRAELSLLGLKMKAATLLCLLFEVWLSNALQYHFMEQHFQPARSSTAPARGEMAGMKGTVWNCLLGKFCQLVR